MTINWIAVGLLLLAVWGIYQHWIAMVDAMMDEDAILTVGHGGLALDTARADIVDERLRLGAKLFFALFFLASAFDPVNRLAQEPDHTVLIETVTFLVAFACLSINTFHRKQSRDAMLFKAMAAKGEQHGV